MIESPFNYTGGKYKLLNQIIPLFPQEVDTFYDIFCGGCNVGINAKSNSLFLNDKEKHVVGLLETLYENDLYDSIKSIEEIIKSYKLSDSKLNGYNFYNCNSDKGLSNYNNDKYNNLKNDFNNSQKKDNYYYYMFYVLIVYSFNNQIRFNSKGFFNLPCGKRDFNEKMKQKLTDFVICLKQKKVFISSLDFKEIDYTKLSDKDFVYADPPYLITCASYNESKGWTIDDEIALLNFLDKLDSMGIRFALSNALQSKGKTNEILKKWIEDNKQYKVFHLIKSYSNSNYHRKDNEKTDEILVINY